MNYEKRVTGLCLPIRSVLSDSCGNLNFLIAQITYSAREMIRQQGNQKCRYNMTFMLTKMKIVVKRSMLLGRRHIVSQYSAPILENDKDTSLLRGRRSISQNYDISFAEERLQYPRCDIELDVGGYG